MQQLASSVLLNHDNANTRTRSERGSILDPSQGSDLGKINSSFKDLYGQVHQQLNQAKQAYHRAETQQVASQNAAQVESAQQPDTVDSTLAQIAAGKKLPSDAAEGDATIAQQLANLSDDEQQQVKQLLAQLLNKLKGDSTEQPDATDTSEQSIGDMLQALLNSATDSSDTELDDDSIAGLQDVLKRLADGDEVSDDELRDALSVVNDLTAGNHEPSAAMLLLASLLGSLPQSTNQPDTAAQPPLIASIEADSSVDTATGGQLAAADKLTKQSAALDNADDKALTAGVNHDKSIRDMAAVDNSALKDVSAMVNQPHNAPASPSVAHTQLSLRLANEQQVQQQELVQRFAPVMRQQLLTMVKDGIQHAEIRLDPPELGSMTVKLQVRGDHTQVQFHVTQTQAKELIEQAMPRLKDLLQQQGMNLADSQVSYGGGSQQQAQGEAQAENGAGFAGGGDNSAETSTEITQQPLNRSDSYASGIDYYA
ncbi:flagellar hook-length control protein FliK [Shewanella sp. A3A]|nr:flagellar hook-length control protein FliK [Shewanella ferrihydritica]